MDAASGRIRAASHRHPIQMEENQVLEGTFEVMVDGHWRALGPGDSASVPVDTNHTFRTSPVQTVRIHNFHRPAGASTNSSRSSTALPPLSASRA